MPRRVETKAAEQPSFVEGKSPPPEVVTLGLGSRSPFVEKGHEPAAISELRGLLPLPPEVEAEVSRQEATHPMTLEYRKILRDRLALRHYFADVEVAFRRTPDGIAVLAAGLEEIAEFRRTCTHEERQSIVYGVG